MRTNVSVKSNGPIILLYVLVHNDPNRHRPAGVFAFYDGTYLVYTAVPVPELYRYLIDLLGNGFV